MLLAAGKPGKALTLRHLGVREAEGIDADLAEAARRALASTSRRRSLHIASFDGVTESDAEDHAHAQVAARDPVRTGIARKVGARRRGAHGLARHLLANPRPRDTLVNLEMT